MTPPPAPTPDSGESAVPALLEALEEVCILARPLADAVRGLERVAASLEATSRNLAALTTREPPDERAGPSPTEAAAKPAAREVDHRIEAAQAAITEALVSLPRAEDYAPVAAQLRELATVSPSLLEWLTEVPRLSTPLAGSVRGLKQAAAELEAARDALRQAGR